MREAQSDAAVYPLSIPVPSSNDLLYVGNIGNNSITIYKQDAQGDTAPLKVIAGSKTGINNPGQLSEDAQGNLYVANNASPAASTSTAYGSVLVFAHGANGNTAPIRKLVGPATDLIGVLGVQGLTVDKRTGKIFVITQLPDPQPSRNNQLLRFPPDG